MRRRASGCRRPISKYRRYIRFSSFFPSRSCFFAQLPRANSQRSIQFACLLNGLNARYKSQLNIIPLKLSLPPRAISSHHSHSISDSRISLVDSPPINCDPIIAHIIGSKSPKQNVKQMKSPPIQPLTYSRSARQQFLI